MAAVRPPISATRAPARLNRLAVDVSMAAVRPPISATYPKGVVSVVSDTFQWPQCGPPSLRPARPPVAPFSACKFQWPQCGPPSLRPTAGRTGGSTGGTCFNGRSAAPHLCDDNDTDGDYDDSNAFQWPQCGPPSLRLVKSVAAPSGLRTFQWPQCGPPSLRRSSVALTSAEIQFQWPQCGPPSLRPGGSVGPMFLNPNMFQWPQCGPPSLRRRERWPLHQHRVGGFNGRSAAPHLCDSRRGYCRRCTRCRFQWPQCGPPSLRPREGAATALGRARFNGRSAAPHLCDGFGAATDGVHLLIVSMAAVRPPISATESGWQHLDHQRQVSMAAVRPPISATVRSQRRGGQPPQVSMAAVRPPISATDPSASPTIFRAW